MTSPLDKLNERQTLYVQARVRGENQTQAAKSAGYAPKSAETQGRVLANNQGVRTALVYEMAEAAARAGVTPERTIQELQDIAFADMSLVCELKTGKITVKDFDKLSPRQRACIASITTSADGSINLKFHSKIAALDLLGKYQSLFTQKVELVGAEELGAAMEQGRARVAAAAERRKAVTSTTGAAVDAALALTGPNDAEETQE